jgi:hypothetical protein
MSENTLDAGLAFVDCVSISASAGLSTDLAGGFLGPHGVLDADGRGAPLGIFAGVLLGLHGEPIGLGVDDTGVVTSIGTSAHAGHLNVGPVGNTGLGAESGEPDVRLLGKAREKRISLAGDAVAIYHRVFAIIHQKEVVEVFSLLDKATFKICHRTVLFKTSHCSSPPNRLSFFRHAHHKRNFFSV